VSIASARTRGPFSREEVRAYLDEAVVPLRLAVVARSGWPVVVSLWFARDGEQLVCATQASSPIVAAVGREPRCAFEVAGCEPPYRGVRGRAAVAVEPDADLRTLRGLVERYLGSADGRFAAWLLGRTSPEVVLRLDPVSVSSWDYGARMSR
jgi:nitroimidazol reductase NimA-like FMN-containing flavoprotein (pyridoxamine 5'-phosphate oxidase superfamily)